MRANRARGVWLPPLPRSRWEFVASLYQTPGITESFDGLALHPFTRKPRGIRRRIEKLRAMTQWFGDGGVPLWVTEMGSSTKGPKDHYLVPNRKRQAKRLLADLQDPRQDARAIRDRDGELIHAPRRLVQGLLRVVQGRGIAEEEPQAEAGLEAVREARRRQAVTD